MRCIRIAGENLSCGTFWEENEEGLIIRLDVRKSITEVKCAGQVQEDLLKGQECWFDPRNGRLYHSGTFTFNPDWDLNAALKPIGENDVGKSGGISSNP